MTKLATPISTLIGSDTLSKNIINKSHCLECRELSLNSNLPKQYLFHFETDIVHSLEEKEKEFIKLVLSLKKELKVITFHVLVSCSSPILKDNIFYPGGKIFSLREMLNNVKDNIECVRNYVGDRDIKIALENNNYYPTKAYSGITDADFISQLIVENQVSLLFDIAHARITAYNKKLTYEKYIAGLPLDRMIQIHISKETINDNGLAYDAHWLTDKSIFQETQRLVHKFAPKYLTVEYYKDKANLIKELGKYGQLCDKPKGVKT